MTTTEDLQDEIERLHIQISQINSFITQFDKEIGYLIGKVEDLQAAHRDLDYRIEVAADANH